MKSHLLALTVTALLLTGCASNTPESKPEYDQVELLTYNICLQKVVDGWVSKGTWLLTEQYLDQAKNECKAFKPVKK